jgi:hypothetical protein
MGLGSPIAPHWYQQLSRTWAGIMTFAQGQAPGVQIIRGLPRELQFDQVQSVAASWTVPNISFAPGHFNAGFVPLSLNTFVGIFDGDPQEALGVRAGVLIGASMMGPSSSGILLTPDRQNLPIVGITPTAPVPDAINYAPQFYVTVGDRGEIIGSGGEFLLPTSGLINSWTTINFGETVTVSVTLKTDSRGVKSATVFFENVTEGVTFSTTLPLNAPLTGKAAVWGVAGAGRAWRDLPRFGSLIFDQAVYTTVRRPTIVEMAGLTPNLGVYNTAESLVSHMEQQDSLSTVTTSTPIIGTAPPFTQYPPWVIQCDWGGLINPASQEVNPGIGALSPPPWPAY